MSDHHQVGTKSSTSSPSSMWWVYSETSCGFPFSLRSFPIHISHEKSTLNYAQDEWLQKAHLPRKKTSSSILRLPPPPNSLLLLWATKTIARVKFRLICAVLLQLNFTYKWKVGAFENFMNLKGVEFPLFTLRVKRKWSGLLVALIWEFWNSNVFCRYSLCEKVKKKTFCASLLGNGNPYDERNRTNGRHVLPKITKWNISFAMIYTFLDVLRKNWNDELKILRKKSI